MPAFITPQKCICITIHMRTILTTGYQRKQGRNRGLIATPKRGALIKKNYRFVDFKRIIFPKAKLTIMRKHLYDPNRTAKLTLICAKHAIIMNILECDYAPEQKFLYNLKNPKNVKEKGSSNFLINLPLGSVIHNIALVGGMGGKFIRAAGTSAVLLKKEDVWGGKALIKLKSGEQRLFMNNAIATLGVVGNHEHFIRDYKKAGVIRRLGIRPRVRPSVMNPVDHPMGGRTKGGCAPRSKTGKLSHGPATASKKSHNLILLSARKSRRIKKRKK